MAPMVLLCPRRSTKRLEDLEDAPFVFDESSDMLLYLAGVNEHAVLRIVGSKRWSVAHF
jgi:hypothetical protein